MLAVVAVLIFGMLFSSLIMFRLRQVGLQHANHDAGADETLFDF
jgi:hypothetical protein